MRTAPLCPDLCSRNTGHNPERMVRFDQGVPPDAPAGRERWFNGQAHRLSRKLLADSWRMHPRQIDTGFEDVQAIWDYGGLTLVDGGPRRAPGASRVPSTSCHRPRSNGHIVPVTILSPRSEAISISRLAGVGSGEWQSKCGRRNWEQTCCNTCSHIVAGRRADRLVRVLTILGHSGGDGGGGGGGGGAGISQTNGIASPVLHLDNRSSQLHGATVVPSP